jgi:hypothetical protein
LTATNVYVPGEKLDVDSAMWKSVSVAVTRVPVDVPLDELLDVDDDVVAGAAVEALLLHAAAKARPAAANPIPMRFLRMVVASLKVTFRGSYGRDMRTDCVRARMRQSLRDVRPYE